MVILSAGNKGMGALSAGNLVTITKLTISQFAFYYQHMLTILNNISDKILVPPKYLFVGLTAEQFLSSYS